MKKVRYVLILVLILLSVGCGKHNTKELSELSKYKNNMLKNVINYGYVIKYDTKVDDNNYTISIECKNDLENKIGYCYTSGYYYDVEKYINYNNKVYYYRNVHPDNTTNWMSMNKYFNSNPNHFLNIVDSITEINKRKDEDGTYYTGIIKDGLTLAILLQEVDSRIDTGNFDESIMNVPIEVFVNKAGYIEKITTSFGKDNKVVMEFADYNLLKQIEIPKEVSN